MRIQNNLMAMNTHRQYNIANNAVASSAEKLSSGYRINRAGDDAAGLAISEKMRAQIRGLEMASKNSQDAISLVQTAEGALQSIHDVLQRMRELAVQSASDTNEKIIDRGALQAEFEQLIKEIDETASKTRFNDQNIIDGTFQKYTAVLGSATAAGNDFGTLKSASVIVGNAKTGDYTFSIVQKTVGYVPPAKYTANQTTKLDVTGADVGGIKQNGFTFAGTAAATETSAYNGDWKVTYRDGTYYATLGNKEIAGTVAYTGGATTATGMTLDFAALGKYTVTFASTLNTTDAAGKAALDTVGQTITNSSTYITVSGGVDEELGETKFYARLDGAKDVEVKVGSTSASFNNGITVNFSSLTATELTRRNGTGNAPADSAYVFNALGTGTDNYTFNIRIDQVVGDTMIIQAGANQGDEFSINIDKMDALFLGVRFANIASREAASYAITQVNNAINQVSTQRAALGAMQNRLNYKIANLDTSAENLQAAESRIRDIDMAKEMTAFTKKNILVQAATAMLAQANAAPQNVLQLLR